MGSDNRTRTERFRELVSLYLAAEFRIVTRRRPWRTPPAAQYQANPEFHELGDLRGIPDVALTVQARRTLNLTVGLDRAVEAARADRKSLGFLIQHREQRDTGEMYVVCTLDTLGRVLQRLERLQELEERVAA
ncbi:hypothetical protein [Agromyces sp. NPDC057865]|uniref:hypothetical protein n=1 Tax=Agromyces sp. NPDC057865 TaxID=3346267 RepID=UPI00366A7AD6